MDRSFCIVIGGNEASLVVAGRLQTLGFATKLVTRKFSKQVNTLHLRGWGKLENLSIEHLDELDHNRISLVLFSVYTYDLIGAAMRYLPYIPTNIPLIVVSNPNVLSVSTETLGLRDNQLLNGRTCVMHANNYVEAAGLILLLREGISADSLYRPIAHIREM